MMVKRIWRGNRLYLINILDGDAKNLSKQVSIDRLRALVEAEFPQHLRQRRNFLSTFFGKLYLRYVATGPVSYNPSGVRHQIKGLLHFVINRIFRSP